MKNLLIILTLVLTSSLSCKAQQKLTGTLQSWDHGKADLIISAFGEPFILGSIEESGIFTIPLTDDIPNKTKKAMEAYNERSSGGRFGVSTVKRAFSCSTGDSLEVVNGEQKPTTLTSMGGIMIGSLEQQKLYGNFMAADSRPFAEAYRTFRKKDVVKGFFLDWYYLEEPASLRGTCAIKAYALNQKDNYQKTLAYDLNFKKGWNIVKISLDETYTDSDSKSYAAKWSYRTVREMPKETQFIFFEDVR